MPAKTVNAERMVTRKQAGGLMMIQKLQAQRSPERTVTLAIPVALDRALELVAAKRDWTKKKVTEWALTGRGEVRREMAQITQNGKDGGR